MFFKRKGKKEKTPRKDSMRDEKLAISEQMMNQPQLRTMGKDVRNPMSPSASNVVLYQIMKDDD